MMTPFYLPTLCQRYPTEAQAYESEEEGFDASPSAQESERAEEEEYMAENADWEEGEEWDKSSKDRQALHCPTPHHRWLRAHHHIWGSNTRADHTPRALYQCGRRCLSPLFATFRASVRWQQTSESQLTMLHIPSPRRMRRPGGPKCS